jgi:predicted PurR-regulated permease PerM
MPEAVARSAWGGSGRSSPAIGLIATVVTIAGLHLARELLIPLALAILLSFALSPLVRRLQGWKLGRIPSVVFVLACAFLVIGTVGWVVYLQLDNLVINLPQHRGKIRERIVAIRERLERSNENMDQVIETVKKAMEPEKAAGKDAPARAPPAGLPEGPAELPPPGSRDHPIFVAMVDTMPNMVLRLKQAVGPILAPLSVACIVAVLVIFLLLEGDDLRDRIVRIGGRRRLGGTTEALNDAIQRVSRYLLVQAMLNGLYGGVIAAGLFLIGVPSWALWGFLCAALRFLPYVGPWLGAATPVIISFATAEGSLWWVQVLQVAGLFIVVELIVNLVLEPWLYGASTGVTSFGILAAAVFWTWIWGPIGLLLATPLTVCCVVLGKHFSQLSYLHLLLGEDEVLSPPEKYYQRVIGGDPDGARAVATTLLEEKPLEEVIDCVIRVLIHSERDRVNGFLTQEKTEAVHESLLGLIDLIEGQAGSPREDGAEEGVHPASSEPRLVIIPAQGEAEAVAAALLGAAAKARGYACESLHEDLLVAETIAWTESWGAEAAFIVLLPPMRTRRPRVLSKRLRARLPGLKIVVAAFGEDEPLRTVKTRLLPSVDAVVKSGSEALEELEDLGFHPEARARKAPVEHAAAESDCASP